MTDLRESANAAHRGASPTRLRAVIVLLGIVVACVAGCSFTPPAIGGDGGSSDGGDLDAVIDRDGPGSDGAAVDATPPDTLPSPACRAGDCAAAGGTCSVDDTKCVIVRGSNGGIVCPAGMPCEVICVGGSACKTGGVDCTAATSCRITCEGDDACQDGPVLCGGSTCDVRCVGVNACQNGGVDCGATPCTVTCDGDNACQSTGVSCEPATACTSHCCGENACETAGACGCVQDAICP